MIDALLNHTVTVQAESVAADALKGIVPTYADLYANIPARIEDARDSQTEELRQKQIFATHRIFCQLPGPINANRAGVRFEGKFGRVVAHDPRRELGGIPTFDVLMVEEVEP